MSAPALQAVIEIRFQREMNIYFQPSLIYLKDCWEPEGVNGEPIMVSRLDFAARLGVLSQTCHG